MEVAVVDLADIAAGGRVQKGAFTRDDWLPVGELLQDILPYGIRRGATVSVATTSLLLALLVEPTRQGRWVAVAGFPNLGMVAAKELGVELERCLLVPTLNRLWPATVSALIDAVDLVVIHNAHSVSQRDARRLTARARERRSVLVLSETTWPESPSLEIHVTRCQWTGIAEGHGYLTNRQLEVRTSGRGNLSQNRNAVLTLADINREREAS